MLRVDNPWGGVRERAARAGEEETQTILSGSFLSVVGTWYVTAIIIIKYIWPDKEMTPGDILTRWVRALRNALLGLQEVLGQTSKGHRGTLLKAYWLTTLDLLVIGGRRQE